MWNALVLAVLLAPSALLAAPDSVGNPAAAPASGEAVSTRSAGGDVFVASGTVSVTQPVGGDLVVSGGDVDVAAAVAGDVLAFGGKLRLGADVGGSVYAAGGRVSITTRVGRNVRVVGGQIDLGPGSELGGNLSIAGGQLRLEGRVLGDVRSAGGRLLINGPVGGDVLAYNGAVELGPKAHIAGKLRYRSDQELRQDTSAQVLGGIDRLAPLTPRGGHRPEEAHRTGAAWGVVSAVWTLGLALLAAAMLVAWPGMTARVAASLRQRPGASLLLGFVWLVCLPVAALVLFITLVGAPLALFALAVYLALMPVGYVAAGVGLGDWALWRWRPGKASSLPARLLAAALALVALAVLGAVPVLGGVLGFLALLGGLGALLLQLWQPPPAAPA